MSTRTRKCNICKQPIADLVPHYADVHGDPNAKFVVSVRKARAAGAPQYGERYAAWLKANGR